MASALNRRELLGWSSALAAGGALSAAPVVRAAESAPASADRKFHLGLITYNLAKDWTLEECIKRSKAAGIDALELRSTHKHGIEPDISREKRKEARKLAEDGGVRIYSLGSACEFHSPDAAVVEKNIELTRQFCELARDVGAKGVKVRPNGLPKEVPVEKTLEQIGKSLHTCGQAAADLGVEIWCEVHGGGTSEPKHMRTIMDVANHPAVGACWNSNPGEVKDGSVKQPFELLKPFIKHCHINELVNGYPYRELFGLLRGIGYDRYTMNECQGMQTGSPDDVVRFLKFYKALWEELSRPACG